MKKGNVVRIEQVTYELKVSLGGGGAGEVWKVRARDGEEDLALKRIPKTKKRSRNERFRNEIAYCATATHPNVVKVLASIEDDAAFSYVMRLYPMTLRNVIDTESDHKVLLDYVLQLCEGLAHVHGDGVVHRDLKPENILVDPDTHTLVIADFGIAHFKDSTLTEHGELLANRNYVAPEQMAQKGSIGIGQPADVFALGLIATEMFTKRNARGSHHPRVADLYPFLSDVDLVVDRMLLQEESDRIRIEAARDALRTIERNVESMIGDIADDLRPADASILIDPSQRDLIRERAARDILSVKYLFERAAPEELARLNPNYHCEIAYRASPDLFNTCVQAAIYTRCKAKFEYESHGSWDDHDRSLVLSTDKQKLERELETILTAFPLTRTSMWLGLVDRSRHYFRFLKDYHCGELLESITEMISAEGPGSLRSNLLNAPLVWLAQHVRTYLATDFTLLDQRTLELLEFEQNVGILWSETNLDDKQRRAAGADLIDKSLFAEETARILEAFESAWDVTYGERTDGRYSVHFGSRAEYERFRSLALINASPFYVFEADVLDLLHPTGSYEDLVTLEWDAEFRIRNTLAKVLGLRDITEAPNVAPSPRQARRDL
ncbi:serine/threonine-protein kinase [Microbacterium atlanticum]|uniref:serine/threonine-protein kinase n=1 Tax=Microbacterium atlanticum TaxID=2782168 RepID=UPI001889899E|nr:serine/threonine-protein kinase [Microbacterium atlanticum]